MIIKIISQPVTLCKEKIYLFTANIDFRDDCWYTYYKEYNAWRFNSLSPNKQFFTLSDVYTPTENLFPGMLEEAEDVLHYINNCFRHKERYRSPFKCDNEDEIKKFLLVKKLKK